MCDLHNPPLGEGPGVRVLLALCPSQQMKRKNHSIPLTQTLSRRERASRTRSVGRATPGALAHHLRDVVLDLYTSIRHACFAVVLHARIAFMKRIEQAILIVTFLAVCWLGMQVVHEFGHVVGALATKAEVTKVALHPFIFSRTDLGHNPHPAVVVWAGPVVGAALPLLVFLLAKALHSPGLYLFRFFAGFCLIANGAYIAFGPSEGAADTGVMVQHGSPRWLMVAFGILTIPIGFYLWHGQGTYFGLGHARGEVSRPATIVSVLLLVAIVGAELIMNSR